MIFIKHILSSLISGKCEGEHRRVRLAICTLFLVVTTVSLAQFHQHCAQAQAQQTPTILQGAAELQHLKRDGQYESVQVALNHSRFGVSRAEHTSLGRSAWHTPNPAACVDSHPAHHRW